MATTTSDDYFWIRQWGRHVGSDPDTIEGEVEKARRDKAPHNAVYYDTQFPDGRAAPRDHIEEQRRERGIVGVWRTTSGITDADTRVALERIAGRRLPEEEEMGG